MMASSAGIRRRRRRRYTRARVALPGGAIAVTSEQMPTVNQ